MGIAGKFKETALSVVPVAAIVLFMGLAIVPLDRALLLWFAVGALMLTLGLTVFLLGVDLGITPVGQRCGAALTARKSLPLMLGVAFAIGLVVTAAEPDIQVFCDQVRRVFSQVSKLRLTFEIAGGVAIFLAVGILRSVLDFSYKWLVFLSYSLIAAVAIFAPRAFVGIAFDSGGATTGPLTVPFIMALGIGVSAVRSDSRGGFGLTGMASIGPLLAVLAYSTLALSSATPVAGDLAPGMDADGARVGISLDVVRHAVQETALSILPLFAMATLLQLFVIRMSRRQFARICVGFAYAFVGLVVFLCGVNCGFMQAGHALGDAFGSRAANGGPWFAAMVGAGFLFGALIVCAEPAVWVLSEQVEQMSRGMIRRRALLVFLAAASALAIALSLWRAVAGFHIAWILGPGYALAMALMLFCPEFFSQIAFDSGGVASGPLTSTFILSFTLGAASGKSGIGDSFGVIALVAMMPLIAIQLMGIIYERSRRRAAAAREVAR